MQIHRYILVLPIGIVLACSLLLAACDREDDHGDRGNPAGGDALSVAGDRLGLLLSRKLVTDGVNEVRWGCLKAGVVCSEYSGPSMLIGPDCHGFDRVDACPTEGATVCTIYAGEGVRLSTYQYNLDDEDIEIQKHLCNEMRGKLTEKMDR